MCSRRRESPGKQIGQGQSSEPAAALVGCMTHQRCKLDPRAVRQQTPRCSTRAVENGIAPSFVDV